MKIKLKHSNSRWIDIKQDDEILFKLLIDYLTVEAKEFLQDILADGYKETEFTNSAWAKYRRWFVRFASKDWQLIENENGEEVKFKLSKKDGIEFMSNESWNLLFSELSDIQSINLLNNMYSAIESELEFTESDKKK